MAVLCTKDRLHPTLTSQCPTRHAKVHDNEEANLVVGCGTESHHSRFRSARMCICDSPISSLFLLFEHRRIGPTTEQRASSMTCPDRHNKGGHGSLAFAIWDIPARTMNKIVLCELSANSPSEIIPSHQFCFQCLRHTYEVQPCPFRFAPHLVEC